MSGYGAIASEIESLVLPGERLSPERVRHSQRRRLALALALESHRRGYEVVSVDQVAEAAQLSKATLYALFGDKQGLLTAVAEEFAAAAGERMEAAAADAAEWTQAVAAGCAALLAAVAADPGPARLALVEAPAVIQDGSDLALIGFCLTAAAAAPGAPEGELDDLLRLATLAGMAAPICDRLLRGRFKEIPGLLASLTYLAINAHFGPERALDAIQEAA